MARCGHIGARREVPDLFRSTCKSRRRAKKPKRVAPPYSSRRDLSISAIKKFCPPATPRTPSRPKAKAHFCAPRTPLTPTHTATVGGLTRRPRAPQARSKSARRRRAKILAAPARLPSAAAATAASTASVAAPTTSSSSSLCERRRAARTASAGGAAWRGRAARKKRLLQHVRAHLDALGHGREDRRLLGSLGPRWHQSCRPRQRCVRTDAEEVPADGQGDEDGR